MTVHIALLRAVNVAGNRMVAMADLRSMMQAIGFEARTLLQSGNLVFSGKETRSGKLEELLEAELARRLGLWTDVFVRGAKEWDALITANPFPGEAKDDPGHLLVLTLKEAPTAASIDGLRARIRGREYVSAEGRQLYAVYPGGIGRSKLTISVIETALGTRATGRNWNTVMKLAALAADFPER